MRLHKHTTYKQFQYGIFAPHGTFIKQGWFAPSGNHVLTLEQMRNLEGEAIQVAPGSPLQVRIPLEERFTGALLARILPSTAAVA